ncbi:hypothetical protein WR25_03718 isoform B [Diploscapter pachys]|uniref:Phosphoinositide phospholipase C n=1 Tax=Diploscapter pachys TaxID=2018661 RepID=A0A2A2LNW9_9BILA|nr:hypothetical protein WR25_03718 isoform B [Diploscapter pachys]
MCQKIMITPWEVDQNLYCTPPRFPSEAHARVGPFKSHPVVEDSSHPSRLPTLLRCITNTEELSEEIQAQCLPVDLRGDRRTIKLVKERKRKLFHSQVYDNEFAMKKLYCQTAKKLAAFGCKVFQVKELLHGRTLRKTLRLLCLSSGSLSLLDANSKLVLKRQHASTLQQWRVGGGINKHQLLLEFRGTKWQLIAPSYNPLKSISMTLWEIMQNSASNSIQKSLNQSMPRSPTDQLSTSRSDSTASSQSAAAAGFILNEEPITLFRLELERLQYIISYFPEEVAYQLSSTEYQLFYSIQPMDYVRYVSCDLTSVPIAENPSPVRNLVKRLSEVSSWITHIIVSNFNGAVEILMGLKNEKLRPFWLSLRPDEKQQYEQLCDTLIPSNQALPSQCYINAIQRALRMTQSRVIPFFGIFLRDLYAIVNDLPNIVVIGHEGSTEKLEFMGDTNGEDHFSSRIGVGGLLNSDKINLVAIVLDNLELFHRHSRTMCKHLEEQGVCNGNAVCQQQQCTSQAANQSNSIASGSASDKSNDHKDVKPYEPIQQIHGSGHGISFIPLDTASFDLDIIQRLQHGTTVIHYDPDANRSEQCLLRLDSSCVAIMWHKISYASNKDNVKEKETALTKASTSANLQPISFDSARSGLISPNPSPRQPGYAISLEEGELKLSMVKEVECVDSYDIDIEAIYRKYSSEEMSVPIHCWKVSYGMLLQDNEFMYFLAPQQIAQYWMSGLQTVVKCMKSLKLYPDRRMFWLKTIYLQLYKESAMDVNGERNQGPRPYEALQAFGGRVERWKGFALNQASSSAIRPNDSSLSNERGPKDRFNTFKKAVQKKLRGSSRDCSRSQSPQPRSSPLVRPPSIKSQISSQSGPPGPNSPGYLLKPRGDAAMSDAGDLDSIYTPRSRTPTSSSYGGRSVGGRSTKSWRSRGGETPNSGSISSSGQMSIQVSGFSGPSGKEFQEKPLTLVDFAELFRLFNTRMRKDLRDVFNDVISTSSTSTNTQKRERDRHSPRVQSRLTSVSNIANTDFLPTDFLTRNSSNPSHHISEKQSKIYNALALASVNSMSGLADTRSAVMTAQTLRACITGNYQFYQAIFKDHEPDPVFRQKNQLSFEGFTRFLSDPVNFAFVPESIEQNENELQYPLSYYYINSSHNTYLTGHQFKGSSSAEMYRQVLLTGCRCVELDVWDGDDGLPLIYHGRTFVSKIGFRQVVEIIKKAAFITSNLPVILSIENHCSLQQQAKMAQMFKTIFGEKLVTNFLFEADFFDSPHLPSPLQLKNRILIKNKKLVAEVPSIMPLADRDRTISRGDNQLTRKQSKNSYESEAEDDDLDEFLEDEQDEDEVEQEDIPRGDRVCEESPKSSKRNKPANVKQDSLSSEHSDHIKPIGGKMNDLKTQLDEDIAYSSISTSPAGVAASRVTTPRKTNQGVLIAPELSDIVIYMQAVKFKMQNLPLHAVANAMGDSAQSPRNQLDDQTSSASLSFSSRTRTPSNLLNTQTPRRQRSNTQLSQELLPSADSSFHLNANARANVNATVYQVTSLNENAAKKLTKRHPLKCVSYTRDHLMRTYPSAKHYDSSNFNPVNCWAHGMQMVALNFQTPDVMMAVNQAMFEQSGNCGYQLKPRCMWDDTHPLCNKFNPNSKDMAGHSALLVHLTVISGQHVYPTVHGSSFSQTANNASLYVEVEVFGIQHDIFKDKTKPIRNGVNPIWNQPFSLRIACVDLAFLRLAVCDSSRNGAVVSHRIVPLRCLRPGYRHLPLRTHTNQPIDNAMLFIRTRFEQEEQIYLDDSDSSVYCNLDHQLAYKTELV